MPNKRKKQVKKRQRKQRGKGILNDLISKNALPEMHLRGFSGKYNFAGPFTRLNKRLDDEGKPQSWSKPINDVDKSAYHHDLCYGQFTSTKDRNNICDKVMIEDMDGIIRDKKQNWRTKADAYIVKGAISTKKLFGLGKKRKKPRKKRL